MGWYSVRCVFQHGAGGPYEERITVWEADGFDDAIERADGRLDQLPTDLGIRDRSDDRDDPLGIADLRAHRLELGLVTAVDDQPSALGSPAQGEISTNPAARSRDDDSFALVRHASKLAPKPPGRPSVCFSDDHSSWL